MRLTIAAVGRGRPGPLRELFDDYAGRSAWPLTLREVEARKGLSGAALKREEAALLLAAVPAGAAVVALDERGRDLDSAGFARLLGRWRDEGRAEAAFQLCTLLFELRDEESLMAELDAGTTGAAERLIALYTARDHRSLIQLRAFGLDAAGQLVNPS